MSAGHVVYYHEEGLWWWKLLLDEKVAANSKRGWRTRRGAMDDWNDIQKVMDRLDDGNPTGV